MQLLANVRVPRMMLRPTRANILLRDDETCQYCGKRARDLTLDHVIPARGAGRARGRISSPAAAPATGARATAT